MSRGESPKDWRGFSYRKAFQLPDHQAGRKTVRLRFVPQAATFISLAATIYVAPQLSKAAQPRPAAGDVQALTQRTDKLSDACRDGRGPDHGASACNQVDQLVAQLRKRGVCWGADGQIEADKHWGPCAKPSAQSQESTSAFQAQRGASGGSGGSDGSAVEFDNQKRLQNIRLQTARAVRDNCLRTAIEYALVHGLRNREEIATKTAGFCLTPLVKTGLMTQDEAFEDSRRASVQWIDIVAQQGQ